MSLQERLDVWIQHALPRSLSAFLPGRRWFGANTRLITAADLEDAAWLPGTGAPCVLVVASVRFADGGHARYAMILAFLREPADLPVLARVEGAGDASWVVEAATDFDAAAALLRGFSSAAGPANLRMLRGGMLEYGDTEEATVRALAGVTRRADVRALGAEQSNTSLRVGRGLVFKLFRRLQRGENPELELGRFLATRTTFRATPMLRGSVTYVSARGETATIGVLQDWVENRGDGWTHVIARLRERDGARRVLPDLRSLGATTAGLHAALAGDPTSAAFAPEPATSADVEHWRASLLEGVKATCRLIERSMPPCTADVRQLAQAVVGLQHRVAALVPDSDLNDQDGGFVKIRIHGDYHLGQTLKTDAGFIVIDFEGEPARPLDERRVKQCALKDVAGMLRSLDYAVETARAGAPEPAADLGSLRQAFLEGYLASALPAHAAFLPRNRSRVAAWLACFEAEKALYEVEYEINNRPTWVHMPLSGLLDILGGTAG